MMYIYVRMHIKCFIFHVFALGKKIYNRYPGLNSGDFIREIDSDPRLLSQRRDSLLLFFFLSLFAFTEVIFLIETASSGSTTNFFNKIRRWKGAVWRTPIPWSRRPFAMKISSLRWWRTSINPTCLVTSLETDRCCVSDYLLLFFNIDGLRHLSCVLRPFFFAITKRQWDDWAHIKVSDRFHESDFLDPLLLINYRYHWFI